ncbi:hypothetical protein DL765_007161 [Monosporascus sp. GIB2]|nr:hypothetical protein DL765_007161 [Monosporascus sp. GIB2]
MTTATAAATVATRRWLPSSLLRHLTTMTAALHGGTPRCHGPVRDALPARLSPRLPGPPPPFAGRPPSLRRPFSGAAVQRKQQNFPPRPKPPPESEIEESFLKGSGPGGQKILTNPTSPPPGLREGGGMKKQNKTNSAVQLRHVPTGVVVKCQATRSRSQNRTIARRLLADRLDDLARGGASRSAVVGEVRRRKKASSAKKSRRKYRRLAEERQEGEAEEGQHEVGDEEEEVGAEGWREERRVEEERDEGNTCNGNDEDAGNAEGPGGRTTERNSGRGLRQG